MLNSLREASIIKNFKKGEYILREDDYPEYLFFLVDGVGRGFFSDDNGNEITDCFPRDVGEPLMGSFGLGEVTVINVIAETDVKVIGIPMQVLMTLLKKHIQLLIVYNQILSKALYRHVGIKVAIYKHDAMGRYIWFLKTYPDVIDCVRHKHVASFLNMTPESLSRVRKKLEQEKSNSL